MTGSYVELLKVKLMRLLTGRSVPPPKSSQKVRAYVERMRQLASSVGERNRRIRELKERERDELRAALAAERSEPPPEGESE